MPDSSITKRALSQALKELMEEMPFQKIYVADICQRCNMNRQSFYYHFKDKYDLLIWIFDTDFLTLMNRQASDGSLEVVSQICEMLYKHRDFYRSAFQVEGQNSLNDHIRELAEPILMQRLKNALPDKTIKPFHINFITDAFLAALMRWISEEDCMTPQEFMREMTACVLVLANRVVTMHEKE